MLDCTLVFARCLIPPVGDVGVTLVLVLNVLAYVDSMHARLSTIQLPMVCNTDAQLLPKQDPDTAAERGVLALQYVLMLRE